MPQKIRTRAQWGATGPINNFSMKLPALGFHLHHTVMLVIDRDGNLNPTDDADDDMKRIERARPDLRVFPYSYCFHPSGIAAEGSGTRVGAHTAGFNSTSFGLSVMGNLSVSKPTPEVQEALAQVIADKVLSGEAVRDFYLKGHKDRKATACPGDNLYPLIPAIKARAIELINYPESPKGWLMALSDKQQDDLYRMVKDLHEDYVGNKPDDERGDMRQIIKEGTAAAKQAEVNSR